MLSSLPLSSACFEHNAQWSMIKANSAVQSVPQLSLFQLLTAGRLKGRNVPNTVFVEVGPQRQQARKPQRCDSYLQSETINHSLTHSPTDWQG